MLSAAVLAAAVAANGLVASPAPRAVSFSAGLLTSSSGPLLQRLREAGVTHLAAVSGGDAVEELLECGELDVLLSQSARGERERRCA